MLIARPRHSSLAGIGGNFYNDGLNGFGSTDLRTAMQKAKRGCACRQPPQTGLSGFWDTLASAAGGALNIVKGAGAGASLQQLEEERIKAQAAAAAANAPKAGSGISTNTMLLAGAGLVGAVALFMVLKKK